MNTLTQRSLPKLIDDAHAAAARLAIATRSWSMLMPGAPAIDEVSNTCEGLRRTLLELRPYAQEMKSPRG